MTDDYQLPGVGSNNRKTRKASKTEQVGAFSQQLGKQLKKAYVMQRRLYETKRDGVESKYRPASSLDGGVALTVEDKETESLWIRYAKRLYKKGIDPVDYVTRIFSSISGRVVSCPMPNQLLSERCQEMYREALTDLKHEIELAFTNQREAARSMVLAKCSLSGTEMPVAVNETIRDESLPLSALFRYCLAMSMEEEVVQRLARRFFVNAAIQYYTCRTEYDMVWGEYIPHQFREDAAQFYESLSRYMV